MHKVIIQVKSGKVFLIYKDSAVQLDIINSDTGNTDRSPVNQEIDNIASTITGKED